MGAPTQNNETAAPGSDPNADGSQSSGKLQRSSVVAVDANLGTTGIHTSGQVEPEIVERGTDALVVTSASLSPPPPDGSTHDAAHDASQEAGRASNGETGQDETPRGPKPRGQISVETDLERGIGVIQSEVRSLPSSPGVYRMLDSRGDVLYVGKARNLKRRVANYAQVARLPYRLSRMVAETVSMEVVHTHTEVEALLLESNFIKRYMPRFNVLLRDDKSFPFIKLTRDHDYPQIAKHRGARSAQAEYFGPFASAGAVNRAITTLQRAFLLRNCTDSTFASRSRPCLQYQIKRCSAPCVGYIAEDEYEALVGQAKAFLAGKTRDVQTDLAAKMQTAAEELDFETAARLRDRIRALSFVQQHQEINVEGIEDADVIAAHTAGGKTCVEVFFFRSGRNYGNRSYFPSHDKSVDTADVLAAFLIQFYENKPPPRLILLSHDVPERDLIAEALTLRTSPSDREGRVGAGQTKKPSMRTARVEIAVPQRGEKRKLVENAVSNAREALERRLVESASQRDLLQGVARVFGLEGAPARIEVYDNSHNQGTDAYGAMIVAGPEGMLKSAYRKFAIKGDITGGDDYAMMQEVMRRRFSRALKEDPDRSGGTWPDLVLIDGGKGQLSAVRETLQELGVDDIPTVAIAKGLDRDAGRERFFMPGREVFTLDHRDPVLYFLQRLRDESHRFVIGTHRAKKIKTAGVSLLDEVPGIGAKRKKALLLHFGSARSVARAGLADLEKVEGINRTVAQKIYDHFHSEA